MAKPDFHPAYLEAEQKFREKVTPLHQEETALRKLIRQNVGLTDEERMDNYIEEYQKINRKAEDLQHEFFAQTENERGELEKILHESGSPDHLIAASSLDADQRKEMMDLALKTSQPGLAKALAQIARQRNEFGTYEKWANDDPIRASALKKHRTLPNRDVLQDRVFKGLKIPRADLNGLRSTAEDQRAAEEAARENEVRRQREKFFNLPKFGTPDNPIRQVGGRMVGITPQERAEYPEGA